MRSKCCRREDRAGLYRKGRSVTAATFKALRRGCARQAGSGESGDHYATGEGLGSGDMYGRGGTGQGRRGGALMITRSWRSEGVRAW